ncbi:MAG: hypothetical protein Q7J80_06840 [Anaerolineales bacterium]|nr:hypothetical protein [Anaerolineales bacterium]
MKNFREIELLSSYLDGQLNASESARLESRLSSDPELASVLFDIRSARGILRKLPARKAPRNFTLTRKMVGLKPPLPRAYPIFRFSTAFATILLMISFAANLLAPPFGFAASAPQAVSGVDGGSAATEAPALSAPFLEMAPAALPTEAAAAREGEPSADALQTPKEAGNESGLPDQASVKSEARVPVIWQIGLLVIILLSGFLMWIMRQSALRKWR